MGPNGSFVHRIKTNKGGDSDGWMWTHFVVNYNCEQLVCCIFPLVQPCCLSCYECFMDNCLVKYADQCKCGPVVTSRKRNVAFNYFMLMFNLNVLTKKKKILYPYKDHAKCIHIGDVSVYGSLTMGDVLIRN